MIKKALLSFYCAFFALTACYSFEYGSLYYSITSSSNMTVSVCSGDEKYENASYTIPNTVSYNGDTYYVTGIASYAFSGCTNIVSISFESDSYVKTIGTKAFSGCNSLRGITIPASCTSIGDHAFDGCFGMTSVIIDDAETTLSLGYGSSRGGNYGLFADAKLTSFYWGRPLSYSTYYGRSPIANQANLSQIKIGPNVTTLSPYMFSGNGALTTFELPATVTSLGEHAFHGFAGMTTFTIPQQITTIGKYAFADCTGLTSLTVPTWITAIGEGAFSGCTGFKSFVVPNSVKSIGNFAFNGCTSMTGLVFEEGEETLELGYNYEYANGGKGLFYDCPLQSAFIGRPLQYPTSIRYGYSPFAKNSTLEKLHFGKPVTAIQSNLVRDCHLFTTLEYTSQSEPTAIESYAFCGCMALTKIDIPATIASIGEGAFKDCDHLANIVIKPAVTKISNYAFNGCTAMTGVVFEESDVSLSLGYNYEYANGGKGLFYDCPIQSVFVGRPLKYESTQRYGYSPFAQIGTLTKAHFGNPLKSIPTQLLRGCKLFTTFVYNENCTPTTIESYAFSGCTSLKETDIVLPESVQTIGEGAFSGCTSLEGYTIPNHVITVGKSAFKDCESMAAVVVKPSVKSIGSFAFNGCTSLTGVVFEESDEALWLGYNYEYAGGGKGMFYDCPLQSVFIGRPLDYEKSQRYGYSPFANNEKLEKVHFGNPIKTIGEYLLAGCKSLTTFEYNKKCAPTSVDDYAFWGCKSITWAALSLPESVTSINVGAFKDCTGLTSIVIKPSVKSIKNYAFNGCTSLVGVLFEEGDETLWLGYNYEYANGGKGLFYDCPLQSVFIGRDLNYEQTQRYGYSPFANILTLEMAQFGFSVTRVPNYLFQGDGKLSSVGFNVSGQLQIVGKYAFNGCAKMPTPTFPTTVTAFEEGAFKGCESLTNFLLPENLATIGSYAFQGCSGFTAFVVPATTTSIGNYAFSGCTGIKVIKFDDDEEKLSLGYGASKGKAYGLFNDCPLEELYLGRTVGYEASSTYGYSPFYKQEALAKVTVGSKVASLPYCIFFGTAIHELYIPSSVRTIHSSFANDCLNLKRVIIIGLTPPTTDTYNTLLANSAENSKFYVMNPDKYKSANVWKNYAEKIESCCEIYSDFTYSGEGHVIGYKTDFPIVLGNRDTEAMDAGTYQKRLEVTYQTNGHSINDILNYEYTIKKAPLTVTARLYTRYYGKENPEFEVSYKGFVNGEDEKALSKEPIASTKATISSPAGEYAIEVSGAEAKNYEMSYVNGILTILPILVGDFNGDNKVDNTDLQLLVDYIMDKKPLGIDKNTADVNKDDKVNAVDVTKVIDIIKKNADAND